MSIEIIGMIATKDQSETRLPSGPEINLDYVRDLTQAHEASSFDRVLVAHSASQADATHVVAYAAAHTERIGFLIAQRPGFVSPTYEARLLATLDQFTAGRVAVHVITGGSDIDQRRDGDHLDKAARYARTDEWLDVVRRTWKGGEPFDYKGEFYDVVGQKSAVLPFNDSGIPVFFGGSSQDAYRVGGKHADVFALWGEPLAETAEQIASVREAAEQAGRSETPGISVSFRPILGATEDEAWERAHQILATAKENVATRGPLKEKKEGVGTKRLLEAAEKGERHDRALWTPIAEAVGAYGNTTALVGTPQTVAQALLDYVDIGVTTLLLRGFDPLDDAIDYGRELIPLVRAAVADREPVTA